VRVPPAAVGGQQVGQRGEQVVIAARAEFKHRDARGRVRHEHVQQPVAAVRRHARELRAVPGDVPDGLAVPGMDVDDLRLHLRSVAVDGD
jgi:hypothetical protein